MEKGRRDPDRVARPDLCYYVKKFVPKSWHKVSFFTKVVKTSHKILSCVLLSMSYLFSFCSAFGCFRMCWGRKRKGNREGRLGSCSATAGRHFLGHGRFGSRLPVGRWGPIGELLCDCRLEKFCRTAWAFGLPAPVWALRVDRGDALRLSGGTLCLKGVWPLASRLGGKDRPGSCSATPCWKFLLHGTGFWLSRTAPGCSLVGQRVLLPVHHIPVPSPFFVCGPTPAARATVGFDSRRALPAPREWPASEGADLPQGLQAPDTGNYCGGGRSLGERPLRRRWSPVPARVRPVPFRQGRGPPPRGALGRRSVLVVRRARRERRCCCWWWWRRRRRRTAKRVPAVPLPLAPETRLCAATRRRTAGGGPICQSGELSG